VIGFPSGGAPPGLAGASVNVLDSDTGEPVTDATVTLNGTALPWDRVNQDYESGYVVGPGATVQLAVSVAGKTYGATATFFDEGPTIRLADPAPSKCDTPISWSGGSPASTGHTLVAVLDAATPNANALFGPVWTSPGGEFSIPAALLTPGERLAFVGVSSEFPVPGTYDGSSLVLVGARVAPLTVVDADFRELTVTPGNRGLQVGESLQLQATAATCDSVDRRDLTATATWSSSDPAVIVSNASGSAGLATGAGHGTAVITADVQGIRGSTIMGSRAFTQRSATGEMLGAVTWTGTTLLAVGTNGVLLSSPDGITWTTGSIGSTAQGRSVAASPDICAVVVGGPSVLTSPDLVSWTARDAGPADAGLASIIWTGDEFVAVGVGGAIVTSTDGITWTSRTSGTPYTLAGVARGGSQLVAVGGYGGLVGQVATSQDGVTWTERDLPAALGYPRAVVYAGTQFVAMGDSFPLLSPDGVTWTGVNGPGQMAAVAASPGELMAVGDFGTVGTTVDGVTWLTWKVNDFRLNGVTWTGKQWVIVGAYGTIFTAP
jgi:hypothetical protein